MTSKNGNSHPTVKRNDASHPEGGKLSELLMEQATIESVFGAPLKPGDKNFNDDDDKVDATWRLRTPSGTVAIWSYRGAGIALNSWSVWYSNDAAHAELLDALGQDR